jgi:antirestriction protein ArdC
MKAECFDIHQHITDQIIAAIEHGAGESHLPWHRSAGNIMRPVNVASKQPYRGVNILNLWATADEKGYTSGAWGTYKQWAEAGAQVRKGERAAYIVLPSPRTSPIATRPKPASLPARRRSSPRAGGRLRLPCPRHARDHHRADRAGRGLRRPG